jgi:phosphoribosylanthranilate isomerase
MLIKVCGIADNACLTALQQSGVDLIGLIFYPGSPRYAVDRIDPIITSSIRGAKLTGIFVDASKDQVVEFANKYSLKVLQFHGHESPEFCSSFRKDFTVIKSFGISDENSFKKCDDYYGCCDYFLFDTSGHERGGTGRKWDWRMLEFYDGKTDFILSGGISINDQKQLTAITNPLFAGVDINSRFEITPGVKDIKMVNAFTDSLKNEYISISNK